jgi:glutathione synthase/RimK-type ligase-like ATP-grasp enzyme
LAPYEAALQERPFSLLNQLREYRSLLTSALRHVEAHDVPIVNSVSATSLHALKPHQIDAFAEAGVPVPATLATNDPAAVESFVQSHDAVVYKPVAGGGYAREVSATDLTGDRLDTLANAPVQFQERVDGRNLRAFVLDGDVVAAGELQTDALDYRTDDHDVAPVELDPAVERTVVRATETLDLTFAGVDVIDTESAFVVLEANPSPMFATFDRLAGTDVAGALAEWLCDG